MILHGSITENLQAAIHSASKHRGRSVHRETLEFWTNLLDYAVEIDRSDARPGRPNLAGLIAELRCELNHRLASERPQ